jgi:hypothetical protein
LRRWSREHERQATIAGKHFLVGKAWLRRSSNGEIVSEVSL